MTEPVLQLAVWQPTTPGGGNVLAGKIMSVTSTGANVQLASGNTMLRTFGPTITAADAVVGAYLVIDWGWTKEVVEPAATFEKAYTKMALNKVPDRSHLKPATPSPTPTSTTTPSPTPTSTTTPTPTPTPTLKPAARELRQRLLRRGKT